MPRLRYRLVISHFLLVRAAGLDLRLLASTEALVSIS